MKKRWITVAQDSIAADSALFTSRPPLGTACIGGEGRYYPFDASVEALFSRVREDAQRRGERFGRILTKVEVRAGYWAIVCRAQRERRG